MTQKGVLRLVTWVAILGLALSVATLFVTQAVVNGFDSAYQEAILGFSAHVDVRDYVEMDEEDPDVTELRSYLTPPNDEGHCARPWFGLIHKVETWNKVTDIYAKFSPSFAEKEHQKINYVNHCLQGISPYLLRGAIYFSRGKNQAGLIKGIDLGQFEKVYHIRLSSDLNFTHNNTVQELLGGTTEAQPALLIGKPLAKKLNITQAGQKIKLLLPSENQGSEKQRVETFTVKGFFESGMYRYDHSVTLMELKTLQHLFNANGKISGVHLKLKNPSLAADFASQMEILFQLKKQFISWQEEHVQIFEAFKLEKFMFFIIMSVLIVLSAFNILGLLVLSIHDRKRDLAILRSVGMSLKSMQRQFSYFALFLSAFASVLGLFLAFIFLYLIKYVWILPLAEEVYMVGKIPVEFSAPMMLMVFSFALVLSVLASRYTLGRLKRMNWEY